MNLLKNTTIIIVGNVIANVLAYAFHFIAGRMLGPEQYGEVGSLMALFTLVAMPASALAGSISKFTSRFFVDEEYSKIAALRSRTQRDVLLFSGIVIIVFAVFSSYIANYLKIDSVFPIIIVGITLLFSLLLTLNRGVLQGLKKFKAISWNSIIEAFARLVLLALFLYFGGSVSATVMAYGFAYFIAYLLVFPLIKEVSMATTEGDLIDMKSVYRFSIQVFLVNIIFQTLTNLPSLFIKHYYSNEFNGYWTAALNIARISQFVTGAISMVMFPEIVAEKNHQLRTKIFQKSMFFVFLSSSAVTLVMFLMPQVILQVLYGNKFLGAAQLLGWMGLAMAFIGSIQVWINYKLAKLD